MVYRHGLSESQTEDAVQETLVRVWQGSARFRGDASVSTWACRIAINQAVDMIRRERRQPVPEVAPGPDPTGDWERRQDAQAVRRAVTELPLPLRSVVVLREFEDLQYKTIAEVLEIPIGTVMSRLHEARARLRKRLGPYLVAATGK
jgi:RNA polymerase sigma-70 factor (ECF subfamily)